MEDCKKEGWRVEKEGEKKGRSKGRKEDREMEEASSVCLTLKMCVYLQVETNLKGHLEMTLHCGTTTH